MFVRPTRLPEDAEAIGRLDTSFTTSAIYEIEQTVDGFELALRPVDPPVVKRFPLDDLSGPMRPWTHSWVAEDHRGTICGFSAAGIKLSISPMISMPPKKDATLSQLPSASP